MGQLCYTIGGVPFPFFRRRPAQTLAPHLRVGRSGEWIAREHLRKLGYELRGGNIRLGRDEIDLLVFDPTDQVLVFLEVKTRSKADAAYRPDLDLTPKKRSAMARAARAWIAEHAYEGGYRLDLLCVAGGKVTEHYKELSWE